MPKKLAEKNGDLYRDKPNRPRQKLKLSLGLPCSINHMYYNTRGGGKRLTAVAEKYISTSRAYINAVIHDSGWRKEKKHVWFYLDIAVFMPDRRTRDSHNMLKLLLDMMEKITYQNDYYVMPNIILVEYDKENPRLDCILRPQTQKEREKYLKEFTSQK